MDFLPKQSTKDFFLSFGIAFAGVGLIWGASVLFEPAFRQSVAAAPLPTLQPRSNLLVGGDYTPPIVPVAHPSVPLAKIDKSQFLAPLSAVSALVVDNRTDTELFSKNPDAVRPLASITKLMSALIILERKMDWLATAEISAEEAVGSNIAAINAKYTADELWNLALVGSSNGAVNALVRLSGLSRDQFVARMNAKAAAWRLNSMRFTDPTGLDEGNVGDARDTARLLKFALREDKIYNALRTGEHYSKPVGVAKPRRVWSTNWLLTGWIPHKFDAEQIAGKTGFIGASGYNFTVKIGGQGDSAVRVVVLGADNNEARFTEGRDLAVWTFDNYVWPDEAGYDDLVE